MNPFVLTSLVEAKKAVCVSKEDGKREMIVGAF